MLYISPPAMTTYLFDRALLADGWHRDVAVTVADDATIASVARGARPDAAVPIAGAALPGMPNLHSHAFQRAFAGQAERAEPGKSTFWSWRSAMYRHARSITPDDLTAIATELYIEMLKAGYTAVGEFHYLHHAPDGTPYPDPTAMSAALLDAAERAGIRLVLLPVLYMASGFGAQDVTADQRRFHNRLDAFVDLLDALARAVRDRPAATLGVALHSLRAVGPDAIGALLDHWRGAGPIHLHIAEQQREVADCLAWCGRRPIEWLTETQPVDASWCLVHATHATDAELAAIARTGAVVGLCPTTEANLGDGLFPTAAFLDAGGRFGLGSDSHVSVSPIEELRWLEYQQRLATGRRTVLAPEDGGDRLWSAAARGGAQALGLPPAGLAPGGAADIVVADLNGPALAGREDGAIADALVFSGNTAPFKDVMVAGRWVVRDDRHAHQEPALTAFADVVRRHAT